MTLLLLLGLIDRCGCSGVSIAQQNTTRSTVNVKLMEGILELIRRQ
jgi:hypothetical protein